MITVAISSSLRIPTSYYYCIDDMRCQIKHEEDCESQEQVGERILNERLENS